MASWHDYYRLGTHSSNGSLLAQSLTVALAAGAVTSGVAFGNFTRAIRLCWNGATGSTSGIRYGITDHASTPAISSTTGTLLPANWVEIIRVSPGQKVSAISNDAGTPALNIIELTD
jgi:hypothetical protein